MSALAAGAALAVLAAVLLNGSYVLQHLGSATTPVVQARRPLRTLLSLLRSRLWALGAVAGVAGWGLHLAALRQAPISVVQAFVAGGLALAAPLLALGLRRRLAGSEVRAVVLMVASLVALSLGLHAANGHHAFAAGALAAWLGGQALVAAALAGRPGPLAKAAAGGLLYGVADLGFKAVTGLAGLGAVIRSPWLLAALAATAAAFFAFQRGLQSDRPLAVIALMTAATNVSSIAGGLVVFGDPLGSTPALRVLHGVAFVLVVVAAWRLAPAHVRLAETAAPTAAGAPAAS